jgi:hypothetical protein
MMILMMMRMTLQMKMIRNPRKVMAGWNLGSLLRVSLVRKMGLELLIRKASRLLWVF